MIFINLVSCENNEFPSHEYTEAWVPSWPPVDFTKEDTLEARELALVFSGEIRVSDPWVTKMLYCMRYIRLLFADTIPNIERRYLPPWAPGEIILLLDDTAYQKAAAYDFSSWPLDVAFLPATVDTSTPVQSHWAFCTFKEDFHPRRMAEMYRGLPGVLGAYPNHYATIGGVFPIIPGYYKHEMVFIFNGGSPLYGGEYYAVLYAEPEPRIISRASIDPAFWEDVGN
ncbi:hypothetical protein F9K33_14340 [bacterium]|nr:MAG: hypothetical protein F9K33_14340 [bacterium]